MIIEGSFYRLIPINDSSPLFDLELKYSIGGKNPREEFKIEGYGYPLELAIDRCCRYAINKKFDKNEVITLKKYLDEFKIIKKQISQQVNGI